MLKLIIFDVDGVLVDSRRANAAFFQNLLRKAGYAVPTAEVILQYFHLPLWQALEKLLDTTDQAEITRVFDMAHDRSLRQSDLFVFPEELETVLQQLHTRYKLAVVTSRIKIGMDDLFAAKNIGHLFDAVITFEDYANPKPHPDPLLTALRQLNVQADDAVYIGDSDTDIEAATAAGMHSIHLASTKHPNATSAIQEFHELLAAIKSLA